VYSRLFELLELCLGSDLPGVERIYPAESYLEILDQVYRTQLEFETVVEASKVGVLLYEGPVEVEAVLGLLL
jgi:hypothetical protein